MILHDCKQRSDEWFRLRLGIPTASEFHRILTPGGKLSAQADEYLHWLLAEWMVGEPLERPESQWMQRGELLEPEAVKAYELETDRETQRVGFVTTDTGMIGCSPDRLIGADGLLEIKCPAPQTHVGYMLTRTIPKDYWTQIQGQLYVCERGWAEMISYCPGLPNVIVQVQRNEEFISKLTEALVQFVERLLIARSKLEREYGPFERRENRRVEDGIPALGITDEDLQRMGIA